MPLKLLPPSRGMKFMRTPDPRSSVDTVAVSTAISANTAMFGTPCVFDPVSMVESDTPLRSISRSVVRLPCTDRPPPPTTGLPLLPPTSTTVLLTPGIMAAIIEGTRLIGALLITSAVSTRSRLALWTSTTGDAPVTVTVSSSVPTRMSALMLATNVPLSSMPSRRTVLNPGRAKVTS